MHSAHQKPEKLRLTPEQIQRLHFLQLAIDGSMSLRDAAKNICVSYRQAKRLKKAFLNKGLNSIVHGNVGRRSTRALRDHVRIRIVHLARTRYATLSVNAFTKRLNADHNIAVSRETVRLILRSEKKAQPASKTRHIDRSGYCPSEGMLVLWGGITKNWFGTGTCCFMAAVDVATLQCLAARFCSEESEEGYFFLLQEILQIKGIPVAICQHRDMLGQFQTVAGVSSYASKQINTSWGLVQAIESFGINSVTKSSRRLIRLRALFEKYLDEQIAIHALTGLEKANLLLERDLIAGYNHQYACRPHNLQAAWRTAPSGICFERRRHAPVLPLAHRGFIKQKRPGLQPVIPYR